MQKLLVRLFPWQIRWKSVLIETLIFLAIYIVWLVFHSPGSPSQSLIGNLAILVPAVTAAVLIVRSLPEISGYSKQAWSFLCLALVCWTVGEFVRTVDETLLGRQLPIYSAADIFNFLAYPFLFFALILYPFENRYAPSRFRFLLDVTISSGVVATLGWLILARTLVQPASNRLAGLVPLVYPIADLVLLMILVNMLLANRKARRTSILWGVGLLSIFISDFFYSSQALLQGYRAGGAGSLGWTVGYLLFGIGALAEPKLSREEEPKRVPVYDLGARLQNILPVALTLVLFWYVLADWQFRGQISVLGLWMSLILSLGLIVRMGIRAGESELHKYWQLFSNLSEPTFICDKRGRILLGNPALVLALGLKRESQIIGKPLNSLLEEDVLSSDQLELAAHQDFNREVCLRPYRTPYLLSLSPIVSEGRKVLIAGAAHDLTEQKRQQNAIQNAYDELQVVYRRLEEMNTQLEQKVEDRTRTLSEAYRQLEEQNKILQALDQLKSDFVSLVSHELRTPLTSLTGGLELLLSRKSRNDDDQLTLTLMKDEIQRLTRFVENILNLSAMEAGRLELHLAPLQLQSVVEEVCGKLGTPPGYERIRVKLPKSLPSVLADEGVLQSILNHLLDNALKYAAEGPVEIKAYRERNRVRIQVTDAGPGIPKEKRRLLFKRFQRLEAKDSQMVYGYGLGLYLSRRLLQAMSSDLEFEPPAEGGARFFFHLKAAK